ncbi:hypothetical protein GE061_017814 [Apolygus lucorum]|uniref:Myosin N-terminal SH3-like domain-containing protein n=1 Tax=Apolygus lucorum TaxID=248454 RepID=A0A8S9XBZ0_APOLU|nr:hypothetical protein GE061_017814 [Apolygus lucorum]
MERLYRHGPPSSALKMVQRQKLTIESRIDQSECSLQWEITLHGFILGRWVGRSVTSLLQVSVFSSRGTLSVEVFTVLQSSITRNLIIGYHLDYHPISAGRAVHYLCSPVCKDRLEMASKGPAGMQKSGDDPDPTPYLFVSLEQKRIDQTKPYDAKKACWVPDEAEGFLQGEIQGTKGDLVTVKLLVAR